MRLSDIIKKSNQPDGSDIKPEKKEETLKTPDLKPPAPATPIQNKTPITKITNMPSESPVEQRKSDTASTLSQAEDIYAKAITDIKNIFTSRDESSKPGFDSIPQIIELIKSQNENLLILTSKSTPDIYLYGHSVNICILSVLLGNALLLPLDLLKAIGYSSFMFDHSLLMKLNIPVKNNKLAQTEINIINQHLPNDRNILNKIPSLIQEIKLIIMDLVKKSAVDVKFSLDTLSQTGTMNSATQIIAIAYIFEALTHPVNHQERIIPHEAIKMIINSSADVFEMNIIKLFVDRISIYPPGSYVRLNTNEIAKVVGINKGLPTRPRVYVLLDPSLSKLSKLTIIDLSISPMVFIKEAIDETSLELTDKRLALELKAMRWWVKGI
ncbi:MAG: hypothetical protein LHV68_03545 [Elusimicrobia bacterium]|nr:hypothetical protein [Candidatus Liberimonas magnetica]